MGYINRSFNLLHPDICLNGGACTDFGLGYHDYQCSCVSSFGGQNCEQNLDLSGIYRYIKDFFKTNEVKTNVRSDIAFFAVPCGPRFYFDSTTNKCVQCSNDQYQDLTNQTEYKKCPFATAPDP